MNRFQWFRWGAVVLMTGTVLLAGCSRPVGSITGKVTYMNKPLKGGSIAFVSTEGRQSFSTSIREDGTFTIDQITGGDYKVCVDTSFLQPPASSVGYKGSGGMSAPAAAKGPPPKSAPPPDATIPEGYKPSNPAEANAVANAKKYMQIPDKYKDADKTDLTYTVTGGPQTHNLELK